ncbi:LamG domain-containing protein [Pseudarthrobacter sp. HLT3-5]|uniref:LamG domain-containing protein n=1 Tax=Pseudarthrobacter cellobiosi TaxID=2953654 RepID=UPI00208E109F|nr:LamG domain-containing protein [Pseudarthrobacter sp. HLT3-5]MCO4276524.1 LamG domain-containing protein [Pseudarthrobacter sp. HLT3-5]
MTTQQGGPRLRPALPAAALALALVIGLAALATPPTSGGYQARVTNSTNTAGTAPYFTCHGAMAADKAAAIFAYRLAEPSGSAMAADFSGKNNPGTYRGTMSSDTTSANRPCTPRDAGGSYALTGTSTYVSAGGPIARASTNTFTLEVWFRTTTPGGRLIGWGNTATGTSTTYDRHIFMNNAGQLVFGVYPGTVKVITTPGSYNDGAPHHVAATLSPAGMKLYVDGQLAAQDPATTTGETFSGFWRIGYNNLAGWGPNEPSNHAFTGRMRYAAAYSTALTPAQIAAHHTAGRP